MAIARLSSELREYDDWLDGVEPAWTALEPARLEALMREPSGEDGALRLGENLTDEELDRSAMVRNALVLLRAAADGDGVELTARGNLTRATVSAMRAAMDWPGCAFEEKRRAGKLLSEDHVDELRLLRALVEEAGLVEHVGGRLRTTARGRAALTGLRVRLQAELFRIALWRVSLNLFGAGECGSWPQQQVGAALWALSTTGDRLQDTSALMKLAVLPDEAVKRNAGVGRPGPVRVARAPPAVVVRPGRVFRGRRGPGGGELAQERAVRAVPAIFDRPRQDRGVAALTRTAVTRPPRRASS